MTKNNISDPELINDIENVYPLRSVAVQDVISNNQGFLTQWATLLFSVILLILLISTNLIYYPDIINVRSKLIGFNAPKEIITKQDGKIIKLFVNNNDFVREGKMLMWIESTAEHQEVINLDNLLDSSIYYLSNNSAKKINYFNTINFTHLGELQVYYQQLISAYQLFSNNYVNGYAQKKIKILTSDINGINILNSNLKKQKEITEEDIKLIKEEYEANESLYADKIISPQELRVGKSKLLNRQISIPQIESILISNDALSREKKKEIYDLQHTALEQKVAFAQALKTLKSHIDDWKKRYIVYASITGKVIFTIPLQEHQYLTNNKIVGFVNPMSSKFYAEVILPQSNFGQIHLGQKVQLRFDAYPYNEFGTVNGKLDFISNVASDTGFIAQISLPNGLHTTQNKFIQYNSGLKADALIITQDLTIYKRLVNRVLLETSR